MDERIVLSIRVEDDFVLDRITVLLGANGSGKSTTMHQILDQLKKRKSNVSLVYIEGGRAIQLYDKIANSSGIENLSLEMLEKNHRKGSTTSLANRINLTFRILVKKGEVMRMEHSDLVAEWEKAGKAGYPPSRPQLPLEKLFQLFSEIFPAMQIVYDATHESFRCFKNEVGPYSLSLLSDGEKQVLLMLAEIATLADHNSIILVDEPELNLNTQLAVKLWNALENEFPEMTFVYATHNVGFCSRENVEGIYVLSESSTPLTRLNTISDIGPADLQMFLGMIPALMSADDVLVTEGLPDSFDSLFYRWITGTSKLQVVAMGGGSDVKAVAERQGIWSTVAPTVRLRGIVDRDFKSEESLKFLQTEHTAVLYYHEAESYICHPDVVVTVSKALGLVPEMPTVDKIKQIILEEFELQKLKIIAKRAADRLQIRIGAGIQKKEQEGLTSLVELTEFLVKDAGLQIKFAGEKFGPEAVESIVNEEGQIMEKVAKDRDIERMLQLTPGKSLLGKIFKLTGAGNATNYMRACALHYKIASHPKLIELQQAVLG